MTNPTPHFIDHLLVVLMEECAEVQQAASKCYRFGLTDENHSRLVAELNDLLAAVEMLEESGVNKFLVYKDKMEEKKRKVLYYYDQVNRPDPT
jgi:NTP pyrophosphatase (non-canonical NTP hydrolase)